MGHAELNRRPRAHRTATGDGPATAEEPCARRRRRRRRRRLRVSASAAGAASLQDRRMLRQAIVGLLMLPLSVLPFIAYFKYTPEGRLLWAKFVVSISRPHLPQLSPAEMRFA